MKNIVEYEEKKPPGIFKKTFKTLKKIAIGDIPFYLTIIHKLGDFFDRKYYPLKSRQDIQRVRQVIAKLEELKQRDAIKLITSNYLDVMNLEEPSLLVVYKYIFFDIEILVFYSKMNTKVVGQDDVVELNQRLEHIVTKEVIDGKTDDELHPIKLRKVEEMLEKIKADTERIKDAQEPSMVAE